MGLVVATIIATIVIMLGFWAWWTWEDHREPERAAQRITFSKLGEYVQAMPRRDRPWATVPGEASLPRGELPDRCRANPARVTACEQGHASSPGPKPTGGSNSESVHSLPQFVLASAASGKGKEVGSVVSQCVYCGRDVRSQRTESGTVIWYALQDGKAACDKHPYTTDPMLHAIQR